MSELDCILLRRLADNTPTAEDLRRINRCVTALNTAAREVGASWRIEAYGSVASGFSTHASDLDATCVSDGLDEGPENAVEDLRTKIAPALRLSSSLQVVEEVFNAKVPLLKLRFEGRLDVDLTCHNVKAIQNTSLLRAYASCSSVVLQAGRAIKLWAKAASVCGASERYLSSYAFTLMLIYSMQVDPNIQLPYLPTEAFTAGGLGEQDERVKSALEMWSQRHASLSVAKVVHGFFRFYAEEFAWGHEVVSVRLGRRAPVADAAFCSLKYVRSARLHVEDPIDTRRNLQCQLGLLQEDHLAVAFQLALCKLRAGGIPVGLGPLEGEPPVIESVPASVLWLGPDPDPTDTSQFSTLHEDEEFLTRQSSVEFLFRTKTVSSGLLQKLTDQYRSSQSTDAGSTTPNSYDSEIQSECDDVPAYSDEEQSKSVDLQLQLQPYSVDNSRCTTEVASRQDSLTKRGPRPFRTPLRISAAPFTIPGTHFNEQSCATSLRPR